MPVKFQKHLLKAVGGVVLTRYVPTICTFIVLKHEKKSMLKVKNVKKVKKKKVSNFKILYAYLQTMVKTSV